MPLYFYSFFPTNVGMRQYWRDLPWLLAFARSLPYRQWWSSFLRDSGGTGLWHETYSMRGYGGRPRRRSRAARVRPVRRVRGARGPMFGSAARLGRSDDGNPVVDETELYGS
ncbi:monooxygenase family protein [Plantactinospora sp. WMMB782]|uniref:monooxygenase family protein n=1 Tax=Plantactinospora sp. WMMB782 TaxID=3404121 RepID=UPI003B94C1F3